MLLETKYRKRLASFILQERRDELEGLDLAIERQKRCLKDLKKEEKFLENERIAARDELQFMRHHNAKETKKR